MTILITGSNGFVGNSIKNKLINSGFSVRSCNRSNVGNINGETDWSSMLSGVSAVIHCAARVHIHKEHSKNILKAYREVNVAGTLRLAKQSAYHAKRFIFLSTIGVNGIQSRAPFTEQDISQPHDAYSISKSEAELALEEFAKTTNMEIVIIRLPLVYGPRAPGNFAKMVFWIRSGVPLPLGAVYNKRSLIAIDNLVSFLLLCADRTSSPNATNQIFLLADGEDLSTSSLLRKVALASSSPARLFSVPSSLLYAAAHLIGKKSFASQLLGNLQVDSTKARILLDWRPLVSVDEQLWKTFKQVE